MSKCVDCGQHIFKSREDYGNTAIRIPFINLKIWRFDFSHRECTRDALGRKDVD